MRRNYVTRGSSFLLEGFINHIAHPPCGAHCPSLKLAYGLTLKAMHRIKVTHIIGLDAAFETPEILLI